MLFLHLVVKWKDDPPKERKRYPRRLRRRYAQHVEREYRRSNRSFSRRRRHYRVPNRRRGIYAPRQNAPTVLERSVMSALRDLRFELYRTGPNRTSEPNSRSETSARRNRRHSSQHGRRNNVRLPAPPPGNPLVCSATASIDSDAPPGFCGLLRTALQATARFIKSMKQGSSFPLIWDSGASHCVTFDKRDFVAPIENSGVLRKVQGIHSGLDVKGIGTVQWSVHYEDGELRHFLLPALYVPDCKVKLISTSVLLQTYKGEVIN